MKDTTSAARLQSQTPRLLKRKPPPYHSHIHGQDDWDEIDQQDGAAWRKYAKRLARWAKTHLVNRKDARGQYLPKEERTAKRKLITEKGLVTRRILSRHFRGESEGDLIGLHAISLDNMSLWLGVDIDLHDDADSGQPAANREAAIHYYDRLKKMGFTPLLVASNGRGGFHLIVLFDAPVPAKTVLGLGRWLVRDWEHVGLAQEPEIFPKQAELTRKRRYGNLLQIGTTAIQLYNREETEILASAGKYFVPPYQTMAKEDQEKFLTCVNTTSVAFPNKTSKQLNKIVFIVPREGYAARLDCVDDDQDEYKLVSFGKFNRRMDIDAIRPHAGTALIVWHKDPLKPGEVVLASSEESGTTRIPYQLEVTTESYLYKIGFWAFILGVLSYILFRLRKWWKQPVIPAV